MATTKSASPPKPAGAAKPVTSAQIADKAVALAADRDADKKQSRATLIKLADDLAAPLEEARELLVGRIRTRSNDFAATGGLSLLNASLSEVGKVDELAWKPRIWKLKR